MSNSLDSLRQFSKVNKADVFADCTLAIETNIVHLYTEDRQYRSPLGVLSLMLAPDDIVFTNKNALREHGEYGSLMHHPHVCGTYVSLADHKTPLSQAIAAKDWEQCGFICFKFLEDFKFGEKAKKFFDRAMEKKVDGEWVPVTDKDERNEVLKRTEFDFHGGFGGSHSHNGGDYDRRRKEAVELVKEKFQPGTRIVFVSSTVTSNSVTPGDTGTVKSVLTSGYTLDIDWDHDESCHFTMMLTSDEIKLESETSKEEIQRMRQEYQDYKLSRRPGWMRPFKEGQRVQLVYSNGWNAPESGTEGTVTKMMDYGVVIQFDGEKNTFTAYSNDRISILEGAIEGEEQFEFKPEGLEGIEPLRSKDDSKPPIREFHAG